MVIRCSVFWWIPVLPWLSDVVFCGCFLFDLLLSNVVFCSGFLFYHGFQMQCSVVVACLIMVMRYIVLCLFPDLPWLSDVVFCGGFLFIHGHLM